MRRRALGAVLIWMGAGWGGLFWACSPVDPPPSVSALRPGEWAGALVQFSVQDRTVQHLSLAPVDCTGGCGTGELPLGTAPVAPDATFGVVLPGAVLHGAFVGPDRAEGTVELQPLNGCCHVVLPWSASPTSAAPPSCAGWSPRADKPGIWTVANALDGGFVPLTAHTSLPVVNGVQGAAMVVLALESSAPVPEPAAIEVQITVAGVEIASGAQPHPKFAVAAPGQWRSGPVYAVLSVPSGPLQGQAAVVAVTVRHPCGVVAEAWMEVGLLVQ